VAILVACRHRYYRRIRLLMRLFKANAHGEFLMSGPLRSCLDLTTLWFDSGLALSLRVTRYLARTHVCLREVYWHVGEAGIHSAEILRSLGGWAYVMDKTSLVGGIQYLFLREVSDVCDQDWPC
jgi:hypothetical protein